MSYRLSRPKKARRLSCSTEATRSVRLRPSGIVSPGLQFGRALENVSGSAGEPPSCSSEKVNGIRVPPPNRLGPNGVDTARREWVLGLTAGSTAREAPEA
jgi:hypothetical protein